MVGDIRDDDALDDALKGLDAVIHLAAAGSVVGSIDDPVGNFESNVVGTFRVLDAARRAGVARTVQASTGGALIGDATPPVNEQSLPKPISPYGASKLAGEAYAHAFAKTYGLRTVAVRFGNVYGPWCDRKRGVLNVYFESLHDGVPLVIYGDGTASRDYVHVSDIAQALQLALEKDVPGGTVVHAASGVETPLTELADLCRQAAGLPRSPDRVPAGPGGRGRAELRLLRPGPRAARLLPHGAARGRHPAAVAVVQGRDLQGLIDAGRCAPPRSTPTVIDHRFAVDRAPA